MAEKTPQQVALDGFERIWNTLDPQKKTQALKDDFNASYCYIRDAELVEDHVEDPPPPPDDDNDGGNDSSQGAKLSDPINDPPKDDAPDSETTKDPAAELAEL